MSGLREKKKKRTTTAAITMGKKSVAKKRMNEARRGCRRKANKSLRRGGVV